MHMEAIDGVNANVRASTSLPDDVLEHAVAADRVRPWLPIVTGGFQMLNLG